MHNVLQGNLLRVAEQLAFFLPSLLPDGLPNFFVAARECPLTTAYQRAVHWKHVREVLPVIIVTIDKQRSSQPSA